MLLTCDSCLRDCKALFKIPCGYYIEWQGKALIIMRDDETSYHNFCLDCLRFLGEKEHGL